MKVTKSLVLNNIFFIKLYKKNFVFKNSEKHISWKKKITHVFMEIL